MPAAVILLAAISIGCIPAARMLAGATWPRRAPAAAIGLWQALGVGWGLATVGALLAIGLSGPVPAALDHGRSGATPAASHVAFLMRGLSVPGGPHRFLMALTVPRAICLMAGLGLLGVLMWILLAAGIDTVRARHRQRLLLRLLAHGDPKVPGALVVDHPAAAAYCVPGIKSAIVVSAGALDLLGQAELAAVLAHERAHLRMRHDLVLLPFAALLRAFNWSAIAREANQAVALLVEMLADDGARKRQPARELAIALLRVGAAGGGNAPAGALAAAATTADGELAARVTRLLRPQPGLPGPSRAVLAVLTIALVVGPATVLLLPL